jgi:hypothetical protein
MGTGWLLMHSSRPERSPSMPIPMRPAAHSRFRSRGGDVVGARRSLISWACITPEGARPRDGATVIEFPSSYNQPMRVRAWSWLKTGVVSPRHVIGVPGNAHMSELGRRLFHTMFVVRQRTQKLQVQWHVLVAYWRGE